jgi:hypothetical protein
MIPLEQLRISRRILKVKIYLYRPLGLQEVEAPRIAGESAHKVGKIVSYTHRPPSPPGDTPGTHSRAIVRQEE